MLWGDFIIEPKMLVSMEVSASYRVVSGVKSSQFLGRKGKTAKLRLILTGRSVLSKIQILESQIEAGNARGLDADFASERLEGLFAVVDWTKTLVQNIKGTVTRATIELEMIEDRGQRV